MGEIDEIVRDTPADAGDGDGFAAEGFGKAHCVGKAIALLVGELQAAPRLDGNGSPGRMQAVGEALGIAYEARGARILADADHDALARGPGSGNRVGLHVDEQLLIDPLGGAPQRQLAQRGEIAGREIMLQRAFGLLWDVNLAFLQALDQIVRRKVDQLDGVGTVEHGIRYGLAHPDMGDLRDDVVEALDVLDVDGRIDVDAMRQQFLDVEIALGVTGARRIGVGEFIDQRKLRAACNQRVDVHLLERLVAVGYPLSRQDFESP